jgi:hypothetical protein
MSVTDLQEVRKKKESERLENLIRTLREEEPSLPKMTALYRASNIIRYGCCDKARPRNCVCMYSTNCPDHGDQCHGTHD